MCHRIAKVQSSVEVVIVRHRIEYWRTSGTGRIAALALGHCRILQLEDDFTAANSELETLSDACLLYPDGSRSVTCEGTEVPRPSELVVLDGSWRQARRMLRRLPALWQLPRLSLPDKPDPPVRLRAGRSARERSTLESIADALALFEGDAISRPLHEVHDLFVECSLRMRGRRGARWAPAIPEPELLGSVPTHVASNGR